MFDIDPPSRILRLGAPAKPSREPADLEDALARVTLAEHEANRANMRWIEAMMTYSIMRAQAQPISAARLSIGDGAVRYERPAGLLCDAGALDDLAGFTLLNVPL